MKTCVDGNLDTICARTTPPGIGGVSVVRLSGLNSLSLIKKLQNNLPENLESHRVYYGFLKDQNLEPIDEVLTSYFEAGRSFTGEDVVEISCHGSPYIVEKILKVLIFFGARMAEPGEFTFRAFMNGRIDLLQAESIYALIHSQNKSAVDLALRNLKGVLSDEVHRIEDDVTWCLAHIESNIDFTSEGLDLLPRDLILNKLKNSNLVISKLIQSFTYGRICNEGLNITIIGEPNVGKSTLFNLLLEEEKAIVTEIPGTTRDLLEYKIIYQGLLFNFLDTAGLRTETKDKIEKLGIEKTRKKIVESEFLILVLDVSKPDLTPEEVQLLQVLDPKKCLIIFNKSDIVKNSEYFNRTCSKISSELSVKFNSNEIKQFISKNILQISAQNVDSRAIVLDKIHSFVFDLGRDNEGLAIFNSRQYEYLKRAEDLIFESIELFKTNVGEEILAIPLKSALLEIQKMHGTYYEDQILDRVFKEFCIGK